MGSQLFEAPREQIWMLSAEDDIVIVGMDTDDGPDHILYDEERIHLPLDMDLVENIRFVGKVLEPAGVRKNGDKAEIVFGSMRTRAVRYINQEILKKGGKKSDFMRMPCRQERADDATLIKRMYSENPQRRIVAPVARAKHIQRFIDLGNSPESATKIFRLDVNTIKEQLRLLDLDKSVQKMVEGGQLPATAAISLSGMDRATQKKTADTLVAEGTTTVAAAKTAAKRNRVERRGGDSSSVTQAPSKRELRRVIEANANLPEEDQLSADFIRGLRVALGDLPPNTIKGLVSMMRAPTKADAAE